MFKWTTLGSGHAHHVSKRGEDDVWVTRHGETIVYASHRKYAYRTTRTVNEFYIGRQQVFHAEPIDSVRVAATYFHEAIVTVGVRESTDLIGRL